MGRALDDVMPVHDRNELHEIEVDAAPAVAVAALLGTPVAADRLVRWLLRLRGVRASGTVEELFERMRFAELHRSPAEVVLGASGTPWRPGGGIAPFGDTRPGTVKVAIDVRAVPLPDERSLLSTETRIVAVDERARRRFVRYWRVVGPFSAVIRRRWLRAAATRLARPA